MNIEKQPQLFPLSDSEKIGSLSAALKKHGKHSLYCCWVHELGRYDMELICTCGLNDALEIK